MEKFYTKLRKNFGRQPLLCMTEAQMLDSITTDRFEQRKYALRNPVHQSSQASTPLSEHLINTKRVLLKDRGINHAEGGWPKDVQYDDEEQTARYRRREERADNYVNSIMETYPKFKKCLDQNNGIEMFQMYFKEIAPETPIEKTSVRFMSSCVDPYKRPVSCCDWTKEDDPKLVVSYCKKKFPLARPKKTIFTCYIWNLENPINPESEFEPPTACWQVASSFLSPSIVVGGLEDGTVCLFDLRENKKPVSKSPMHVAHRDPVTSLQYMNYRTNTEFFTASTDGLCMWWDIRFLSNPTDTLGMSIRIPPGEQSSLANSEAISCLQFEKQLPTRFMCGTDTGFVINVNRKGKTQKETMSAVYKAHDGPVKALHRSPCTSKMFITCGDWAVHIWSDDVLSSPIITGTSNRKQICDVVWAPKRLSSYMSVSEDGKFSYWDLLRKTREPVIQLGISKSPLLHIKPQDDGRLVAIGDASGVLTLLSLSDNLVESVDCDKAFMLQTYERETRREHILENRVKEIRLKLMKEEEPPQKVASEDVIDEEALIKAADQEYKKSVFNDLRQWQKSFLG